MKTFCDFIEHNNAKESHSNQTSVWVPSTEPLVRGDLVIATEGKFKGEIGIVLREQDNQLVIRLERNKKKVWVSLDNCLWKFSGKHKKLPKIN